MKQISVILLLAFLSMAACSSGTSTENPDQGATSKVSDSGSAYDPCQLLTQADVQQLFPDGSITLDQHDTKANPVGMKICFYSTSDDDMKFAQLSVTNAAEAPAGIVDKGSLRPLYESERELLDPADIQEVTGLGDAAYYGGSGLKPGAGLHVLDDAHSVKLDINVGLGFGNDDETAHLDIEKSIAETALSRL